MQTFFNPTTPLLDDEGHILVGAMVSFLDLGTSASFISLTDSEGVPLPNPLYTGSDGRLRLENGNGAVAVPCIADGTSYKVVVARRTGVDPVFIGGILQNPGELYENPQIVFVVTASGSGGASGNVTVVGSVAEVRLSDKALGSVICSGYYSAGDCPARAFTWVELQNPPVDNGIDKLRNPEDATGYWKMSDPDAGTWDVRIAGLDTTNSAAENSTRLQALVDLIGSNSAATRIYFPAGSWRVSSGFTCYSKVVFGRGAKLSLTGANSKTLNLYGGVESYCDNDPTHRAIFVTPEYGELTILCGQGSFRSSWIVGATIASLSVSDTLVVDSDNSNYSDTGALVKMDELNRTVCVDGGIYADLAKLGNDWMIEPDDTQTVPEFKISKGVMLLAKLKVSLIEFFSKVKMSLGFLIDSDNAWETLDDPQSDWHESLVLKVQKLICPNARVGNLNATAAGIAHGIVSRSMRYDESFVAIIAAGNITFFDGVPVSQETYSGSTLNVSQIYNHSGWTIPSGSIVHIVAQEVASLQFCFPDSGLDCIFVIDFPWLDTDYSKSFKIVDDSSVVLADLKVLGVFAINSSDFNLNRVVVRAPTAAERTKYVLDSSLKWIIDPFVM